MEKQKIKLGLSVKEMGEIFEAAGKRLAKDLLKSVSNVFKEINETIKKEEKRRRSENKNKH